MNDTSFTATYITLSKLETTPEAATKNTETPHTSLSPHNTSSTSADRQVTNVSLETSSLTFASGSSSMLTKTKPTTESVSIFTSSTPSSKASLTFTPTLSSTKLSSMFTGTVHRASSAIVVTSSTAHQRPDAQSRCDDSSTTLGDPSQCEGSRDKVSRMDDRKMTKTCQTFAVLTVGISAAVLVVVIIVFIILLLMMRKKWREKIKTERHKTDLWSLATYNNTIINDNFLDYKLASPRQPVETSGHMETSFSFNKERPTPLPVDNNTLRRNTYSSPEDALTNSMKSLPDHEKESVITKDLWQTKSHESYGRDRSLTFTTGKKFQVDKHVLLKHEEEVDTLSFPELNFEHTNQKTFSNENITEL